MHSKGNRKAKRQPRNGQKDLRLMQLTTEKAWQPTPVLLPGKSHGRRSLVSCSPWGRTESDMTEVAAAATASANKELVSKQLIQLSKKQPHPNTEQKI